MTVHPPPADRERAVPVAFGQTTMQRQQTDSVNNNILSVHRQMIGNNSDVNNVLVDDFVRPSPVDRGRALPVSVPGLVVDSAPAQLIDGLGVYSALMYDSACPPPTHSERVLPAALGVTTGHASAYRQTIDSSYAVNVSMYGRAPSFSVSNMTAAVAVPLHTLVPTGCTLANVSSQLGLPRHHHHRHHQSHPTTAHRETVPGVRQRATGLRHHPSAHSPSSTTPTVRSTADFRPDLDWDAGRITDFNRQY